MLQVDCLGAIHSHCMSLSTDDVTILESSEKLLGDPAVLERKVQPFVIDVLVTASLINTVYRTRGIPVRASE